MVMRRWTPSAGFIFLLGWSVYMDQANFAGAQVNLISDGASDAPATQPADNSGPKVVMNDSGTFSIQINSGVDLLQVLRMLASQAQISIIPGKDVRGTVPAMDLYNVSVYEALDAILQTNGFHWKKQGNFIYVYTQSDWDKLQKANHQRQ